MQKAWVIQLAGLMAVLLLMAFTLPRYARALPERIAEHTQQYLHEQGMPWASVQAGQANSRDIAVNGTAPDADAHWQAIDTARSQWYVQRVEDNISTQIIEPYTLHIQWDGKSLSLDGYVSDDEAKSSLAEQIQATFGDKADLTYLQTGAGAPDGWETLIGSTLLKEARPLESASIRMTDKTIRFAGKAATTKQVEALRKALEPIEAQGYNLSVNMVALDSAAVVCQQEFNRLLSQKKIVFASGGSTIDRKSDALLQELADTAIFCADSTVLISGHTDNVGSEENNLKLSEQRAKAVKGWLFNQGGVPLERLKTEGKGAAAPLADNDTEEGRAKNRRIEFIVEGI
ncbi:OmpA family protein [Thiothrix nivea]|uniref:OmpA/MotB domain protein n=1 Tax=Thiothrix nivea (strain ATCC 35100 / DSM 5205 / JP2) TaxID=870187 RepID=A0A656HL26_THINJ|nr:OmpA family protein [Thiothrix nivea]EIJ36824.1 OmpA/MotB domain protein [Thiothrix nivea DSM 5205]